ERVQASFDFRTAPSPALRAVQVTVNEAAAEAGLSIPPNMRVPVQSVIHRLFSGEDQVSVAEENLSWWTSSDGGSLPELPVRITARWRGDHIQALVVPMRFSGRSTARVRAQVARRAPSKKR